MHERWSAFTYDVTIKLKHAGLVPHLKRTGVCSSQARSKASDDRIFAIFDKHHSKEDFRRAEGAQTDCGVQNPIMALRSEQSKCLLVSGC